MIILGASSCVAVRVFTLWARSLSLSLNEWIQTRPDLSCVQTVPCSRSTTGVHHGVQSAATFSLYRLFICTVCSFVLLLCRYTRRLTDQIQSFLVILYEWIAFIYLYQRMPEFHFTIKKCIHSSKEHGRCKRYKPSLFGVSLYSLWDPYLLPWLG